MATETHSNDDSIPHKESVNYILDERRRAALSDVDNAAFSWFHVKVATVAGVGFFTDALVLSIRSTFLILIPPPTQLRYLRYQHCFHNVGLRLWKRSKIKH